MKGYLQLGEQAEMITGPHAAHILIKNSLTSQDVQRWAVDATPNQDVVDATAEIERHFAGSSQRVSR